MIIDTSALIAILQSEKERDAFTRLMASQSNRMSAACLVEASIVSASRKGRADGPAIVDDLVRQFRITLIPLDAEGALAAREAYFRYGKGYHPAGLNFADCVSYALAKSRAEPLLFKGENFLKTDVIAAWRP